MTVGRMFGRSLPEFEMIFVCDVVLLLAFATHPCICVNPKEPMSGSPIRARRRRGGRQLNI